MRIFLLILLFSQIAPAATDPFSPACRHFDQVVHLESKNEKAGFQMDQVVIHQHGQTVYQWANGIYKIDSLHSLWSASKTIAATLAGAAIEQGRLHLDDKLKDFFPHTFSQPTQQKYYDSITIENLINMSSGYVWDESYESNPAHSSFIEMIYGRSAKSMADFALAQPLEIAPGLKWNYSGGNANILMAILGKIYGSPQALQNLLFEPLGLTKAFFEQDATGHLIGSSYAYMTPEEMARIGDLYLQNGVWNEKQILPADWVSQAQVLSAPLRLSLFSGDKKYEAYIKSEGVFSNRSFWLNQDVPQLNMKHEFPHAPANMFFAAGHYGQLILVLPSENMVIAATGHNKEYWSKIDKLVSSALTCFAPESGAVAGSTPPPKEDSSGFFSEIKTVTSILKKGYLQAILAKELCSCTYVSGLNLKNCLSQANLPMSQSQLHALISLREDASQKRVIAKPTALAETLSLFQAHTKSATYHGIGEGCRLDF